MPRERFFMRFFWLFFFSFRCEHSIISRSVCFRQKTFAGNKYILLTVYLFFFYIFYFSYLFHSYFPCMGLMPEIRLMHGINTQICFVGNKYILLTVYYLLFNSSYKCVELMDGIDAWNLCVFCSFFL